ncbi:MAG: V-type ATPase subunit [Archangium sp.]|nr:V-type ATPase subunit [Archangium sp.]
MGIPGFSARGERSPDFSAAAARARGLTAHLFTRAELEALAEHDVTQLARSPKLVVPVPANPSPLELERAVRLTARHHLRTLTRWDGAGPVLAVFYAEQDRLSLRAMLRGALATAPAEERLAGLIPTPTLPERVLAELARQPTPAAIAAHLFAIGHPEAGRLAPLVGAAQPDLLALELALMHGAAERARREARWGDENLRLFVAQRIDTANVEAALLLATAKDVEAGRCFVEGGLSFTLEHFLSVVNAKNPAARLRELLSHTPLVALLNDPERAGFVLALSTQQRAARLEPLSSAPVLLFLLRLEGQERDLRRILQGAALGAPAAVVRTELVTP